MISSKDRLLCALSYLGILFFLPLLDSDNREYARFHANQALILLIFAVIANIAAGILGWIPLTGWLIRSVLRIAIAIFGIIGIVNGATGKMNQLPVIGGLFKFFQ